jgi:hypothetical protein
MRRQELEALPQDRAAARAQEIAHLELVERVLGRGCVDAIVESRALVDKDHASPRQSRWSRSPRGGIHTTGSVAIALQLVEPVRVGPC